MKNFKEFMSESNKGKALYLKTGSRGFYKNQKDAETAALYMAKLENDTVFIQKFTKAGHPNNGQFALISMGNMGYGNRNGYETVSRASKDGKTITKH